jgi:hypothetical protein
LSVQEVRLGEGARSERFCVCVNPEARQRDEIVRKDLVAYLDKRIAGSDAWTSQRRDELVGELRQTPGLARFLRRTKDHKLRIDKAQVERDAHFAGKWLIRTSNDTLTSTDLALAYKQLSQVKRGWRDLEGGAGAATRLPPPRGPHPQSHPALLARPAPHPRGPERDRRHLAQPPQRARSDGTRHAETQEGRIAKRSATTKRQREILAALEVREPAQILDYELPTPVE